MHKATTGTPVIAAKDSPRSSGPASVQQWQRAYANRLFLTDFIVVVLVVIASQFLRFGADRVPVHGTGDLVPAFMANYDFVSLFLIALWLFALDYQGTRDWRQIGGGFTEYKRVADATFKVFGVLAILAFVFQWQISRGYLLVALPTGLFLLLFSRWLWRQWLLRQRRAGKLVHRAVIIGEEAKAGHVAAEIGRQRGSGFTVVGTVVEELGDNDFSGPLPAVLKTVAKTNADTVILTGSDFLGPRTTRELGWALAKQNVDLVVAPALTDVAGPRIHHRPVAGLPLIHVDYPSLTGRPAIAKRAFDIVASFFALVVLSPVFLAIAIAVKLDSPGPVFFSQERVGLKHSRFRMHKFRSMVVDAEKRKRELVERSDGNGVLFKMRTDPRVTKIGAFLRRYSLDELPQFFNVLKGEMSLVGPRPPLPIEVDAYDDWARRRLLVKPGITGLWQVQGRSDLSWEDSIRLDLYYVENWSVAADIIILFRTVKAVVKGTGAY